MVALIRESRWLFSLWVGWTVVLFVAAIVGIGEFNSTSSAALGCVESLIAFTAIKLFAKESQADKRAVFWNFAALFGLEGVLVPAYYLTVSLPLATRFPSWPMFFFEYSLALYFFLLMMCVAFLIICLVVGGSSTSKKYVFTFLAVGGTCLCLFYPFIMDPNYVSNTPDSIDYRSIRFAVHSQKSGNAEQDDIASIAQRTRLFDHSAGRSDTELAGIRKDERIAEILPYIQSDFPGGLVWKPLHYSCAFSALISTCLLLGFSIYWYVKGPPASVYMEKIVWVFVPYCMLEGLHFFIYTKMSTSENYNRVSEIGAYCSMLVMLGFLVLFTLRLRFIATVEGKYYERALAKDSSRLSRWRDEFDRWIVNGYLKADQLDNRFLISRGKKR